MRQLLLPGTVRTGQQRTVAEDEFHYLVRVRRHTAGDELQATDSGGNKCTVRIADIRADSLTLEILGVHASVPHEPEIVVCQAIPKGRKLDDAIRSLVQAGASGIVPVFTEHTVVRHEEPSAAKQERRQRVAKEAVQQSGGTPVTIREPRPLAGALDEYLPAPEGTIAIYLHTEPLAHASLHGYLGEDVSRIVLFVGPEGGFSPSECDQLQIRGARPLWLGPRVYRTETAGLVAVSASRLLLIERSTWQPTK